MKNPAGIILAALLTILMFTGTVAAEETFKAQGERGPAYDEGTRGPDRERGWEGEEGMRGPRRGGEGKRGHGGEAAIPPGKWWRMLDAASLKISEGEKEKLDNLYRQHRRGMIDMKGDVEKEKLELEYLLEKKKFDESAVKKQFSKLQDAKSQISVTRFNFVIEVRRLLGYKRFQELKRAFKDRKRRGRGPKKR